LGAKSVLK